jgi:hypothetical protein
MFPLKKFTSRLRGAPVGIPPRRRLAFRGSLEQLEGRQLLSTVTATYPYEVAAAAVGANTSYVLEPGGNLYEHVGTNASAGWSYLSGGVAQISAGRDSSGQNAVYAVLTNGSLDEITSKGRYLLASGVSQISASQFQSNTVFALMDNGYLYEISGTGGTYLASGVSQISAGRDSAGNASVFALFTNNVVKEHTSTGWDQIANGSSMGNAVQISASQFQSNTAFVRNTAGSIFEYSNPNNSPLTVFRYVVYSGASAMAAGRDPSGSASVYYIDAGSLYEMTSAGGPYFVASNVSVLDQGATAQYQADTVYTYGAVRNNRTNFTTVTLDEFVGNGSRSGYDHGYYVTSFTVAP